MNHIKYILEDMLEEYDKTDIASDEAEKLVEKYAKILDIQAKVHGDVFTIEDFIDYVKTGSIISYDGIGYYWDEEKKCEVKAVSFNPSILKQKAKKYKYVVWYNR